MKQQPGGAVLNTPSRTEYDDQGPENAELNASVFPCT